MMCLTEYCPTVFYLPEKELYTPILGKERYLGEDFGLFGCLMNFMIIGFLREFNESGGRKVSLRTLKIRLPVSNRTASYILATYAFIPLA